MNPIYKSLWFFLILPSFYLQAQTPPLPNNTSCKVSSTTQPTDSISLTEREELESFTAQYVASNNLVPDCYVIPVVFHVYGTIQGGMPVNNAIIIDAVDKLNLDFHGLNADYGSVHNSFQSIRSTMPDVVFALAQKDPNGAATTGIVYHPVAAGYANGSGYDAAIAADAWDNYKYMNIYIMNDLFNDGVTNNSGYAYYPSTTMSNNNTARIVYNGAYLGINCTWEPEFASTLTHEYGHWLNLIHTFDGGCMPPNDQVNDTPPCDFLGASYPCHPNSASNSPLNCNSDLINAENYMDYSGASGCYKMFTQGQVARMYAALQHPTRQPLWQMSNLIATGLDHLCSNSGTAKYDDWGVNLYPNPSTGKFNITFNNPMGHPFSVIITSLIGQVVHVDYITHATASIDLTGYPPGMYWVQIKNEQTYHTYKIIIE
jgi:hypothetical protein